MKLIIIGGVAGGASAAARARRMSEQAEIILFERGPDVSFANCGLPYYLGGEIKERSKLLVTTPDKLRARFEIDVRVRTSVEKIDRANKLVYVRDLATNREYTEHYDKIILSPGAAPLRPNLPGIDLPGIYTLRNLQDTDHIKASLSERIKHAVVIGGGFIGLELIENFLKLGIETTLVEYNDQVLPPFDKEMTTPIVEALRRRGANLLLGDAAESFAKSSEGIVVHLKSGKKLVTQLAVLGVGVRPENKLALDAGLEIGKRGGIHVNAQMQTTDPDIYAVGDAVETTDFLFGGVTQIPLAGPANRQGRIAADHALGRETRYRGTQGTAIVGVFEITAAMTGASEKWLRQNKRSFRAVYVHPANHASYYPGAEQMTIKLLFDPDNGRVLGGQVVGGSGADKRTDVLAMAIQAGMTVFDLEEAELAYAPAYGSAKDPINMAGFVAANWIRGDHPQMGMGEWLALPETERPFLLDVRTPAEFEGGHLPGATNIPVDDLRKRLGEIPKDKEIATYCQVGQRGYIALRILMQSGYRAMNLSGGYKAYRLFVPEGKGESAKSK